MKVLVVAGPTAAGKSAAALEVAERWGAVIVSADAMQVYRGMDIGTAKPTPADRARVPHVGIDVVDPIEAFDAARFVALAEATIAAPGPVVVAGGTSLYIRSLIRGLVTTPPVDAAVRAELEADPDLHARLARVDPVLAERLHPRDRVRLVRGMEAYIATGRPMSELQAEHASQPDRHEVVGVWLDRSDLSDRIDARLGEMMAAGYLDEVRGLLASGVPPECKPMQSFGYRHMAEVVLGWLSVDEGLRRTARDTRQFARKQRNWMKHLRFPRVLDEGHLAAVVDAARLAFGPPGVDPARGTG